MTGSATPFLTLSIATAFLCGRLPLITSTSPATQSSDWRFRPFVGRVLGVSEAGHLTIELATETTDMTHVFQQGMVVTGHHDNPIGIHVFRLAGVELRLVPDGGGLVLSELRRWLIKARVQVLVAEQFSGLDSAEPTPAVLLERDTGILIQEQVIQHRLGRAKVDVPGAIGAYYWSRISAATEARAE